MAASDAVCSPLPCARPVSLFCSAGPHVCIGMGLFMTEAKVLLALLGRDYDITLVDDSADVSFHMSFVNHLVKGAVRFSKTLTAAAA